MSQIKALEIQDKNIYIYIYIYIYILLFSTVGTASLQRGLEARTVCGRSGNRLLKNKLALKQLVGRLPLLLTRLVFYCTTSCDMRSQGS